MRDRIPDDWGLQDYAAVVFITSPQWWTWLSVTVLPELSRISTPPLPPCAICTSTRFLRPPDTHRIFRTEPQFPLRNPGISEIDHPVTAHAVPGTTITQFPIRAAESQSG